MDSLISRAVAGDMVALSIIFIIFVLPVALVVGTITYFRDKARERKDRESEYIRRKYREQRGW